MAEAAPPPAAAPPAPAAEAAPPPPAGQPSLPGVAGTAPPPLPGAPPGSLGKGAVPGQPASMQFASLYVGDLHPDCGEATLYEAFSVAGTVASCRVCRESATRKSLGYGYVNYYSVQDAEKALDSLNYTPIKGKTCRIMWSQRDTKSRTTSASNIFVKNLDPSIDAKALHDTFSIFGNILSCKVSMDNNGKSKGYGFVHYEAEEAAKQAIERVNNMKIGDNTVFVGPFLKREEIAGADGEESYTNLYVKNLPPTWDDEKVSEVFKAFGEVTSSVVMNSDDGKRFALVNFKESDAAKQAVDALHRKDMRGEVARSSEGAAAVTTSESNADDADAAAESGEAAAKVEGDEDHPAHLLYVQRAMSRAERRTFLEEERKKKKGGGKGGKPAGVRLCIRNLGPDKTTEDLRKLFEPFGEIQNVVVRTDDDGKCRGVGFISFSTVDEATKAVSEMHLRMVDEKPLNVGLAERRNRRGDEGGDGAPGSPSGGGGRSGGKGRDKGKGDKGKGREKGGKGGPPSALGSIPPAMHPFGAPLGKGCMPPGYMPRPPHPGMPLGPPGHHGAPGALPPSPTARLGAYSLPPALSSGVMGGRAPGPPGGPVPLYPPSPYPPGWPVGYRPPVAGMPGMPFPGMPLPGMLGIPPGQGTLPGVLPSSLPAARPAQLPMALTKEAVLAMPLQMQKQHLGERLFALTSRFRPDLAGKITGMMLELQNNDIFALLESEEKLKAKINEAVIVLERQQPKPQTR